MNSPAPQFQTKESYAYQTLREAILRGEIGPGERLVIDRLSREMGISQIPIRAALQRLESEGLVEITPHSGAVVTAISQDEIGEIFLLLEALEGPAFRQAADAVCQGRVMPPDLQALRHLLAEMESAAAQNDLEAWAAANDRFHRAVAALSGMKLLAELTGRVLDQWARLRRVYVSTLAKNISIAQEEHSQMVELLENGDAEALAALVAGHNRRARQAYSKNL